ncbi:MAG: hypothetical protein NZZ41_02720 [Candidatus Dojkabacteria bacterium]|nr:hypothetical protein [Candidatus Dojkabacteria bacterium]
MTEQQYKLKIQASMLDHSLQHQLAERIQNEKKRKEIQECLARINALYREL